MRNDGEEKGTTRISVRIPKNLKNYLESMARENQMTLSEFIRNALIWFQMGLLSKQIQIPKQNSKKVR